MKRRRALQATLALAATGPAALRLARAAVQPGQVVAWPEVTLLDGSRFTAEQAAGQAMVVVFWSTTCPFCRRHNQHIEKLHRAAAGQGLRVLGVARDRDAAAVRRYAQQQGYSFAITMDHAPLAAVLASRGVMPLTVTVGRDGRLKEQIPGEMFEADVMDLLKLAKTEVRA